MHKDGFCLLSQITGSSVTRRGQVSNKSQKSSVWTCHGPGIERGNYGEEYKGKSHYKDQPFFFFFLYPGLHIIQILTHSIL